MSDREALARHHDALVRSWKPISRLKSICRDHVGTGLELRPIAGGEAGQAYAAVDGEGVQHAFVKVSTDTTTASLRAVSGLQPGSARPPTLHHWEPLLVDGALAMVSIWEYVDGTSARQMLREGKSAQAEVAARLCGALGWVHGHSPEIVNGSAIEAEPLQRQRQRWLSGLVPSDGGGDVMSRRLSAIWREHGEYYSHLPFPIVVLHGDAKPEHFVFAREGGECVILDWDDIAVGDPAWDVAWLRIMSDPQLEAAGLAEAYSGDGDSLSYRIALATAHIAEGLHRYYRRLQHPLEADMCKVFWIASQELQSF